jgi:hypothetical protein
VSPNRTQIEIGRGLETADRGGDNTSDREKEREREREKKEGD